MGRSQGGRGTCSIHDREERYFLRVENLHPLNFFPSCTLQMQISPGMKVPLCQSVWMNKRMKWPQLKAVNRTRFY